MQAKQLAFFVIAFFVSLNVINASGIFDVTVADYEIDVNDDLTEGITEINDSVSSSSDLTSLLDGWNMLKSVFGLVVTILKVLAFPYPWFVEMGVSKGMAAAVQTMATLTEAWGFITFVSNRSDKGMG